MNKLLGQLNTSSQNLKQGQYPYSEILCDSKQIICTESMLECVDEELCLTLKSLWLSCLKCCTWKFFFVSNFKMCILIDEEWVDLKCHKNQQKNREKWVKKSNN